MDLKQLEAKVRQLTSEDADVNARIPGVVLISEDTDGRRFMLNSGKRSLKAEDSMNEDTVFWIASVTKIMTTVAAVMCVERGLIELDSDVTTVLPELRRLKVLKGFQGDSPTLADVRGIITLRKLLTHSSGIGYDILNPDLRQYGSGPPKAFCGELDKAFFDLPLVYQPAEGWQYGAGIDWVGVLVRVTFAWSGRKEDSQMHKNQCDRTQIERLNGNMKLGEFLDRNMWKPLGMHSTTFHLENRPDLASRLATVSNRTADGLVTVDSPRIYAYRARDDSGGAGAYSTPADVMKLLCAILCADPRLLQVKYYDEMFRPQLESPKHLEASLRDPVYHMGMTVSLPEGASVNFGLGGLLCLSNLDTGRKAGSMQWGGYPNLAWWVDRAGGRCGAYFSQLIPSRDQPSIDLKWDFEGAVYAELQG